MKYYSTNKKSEPVSFKEAVLKGIADDGGLFMPETIPALPKGFWENISKYDLREIGYNVSKSFLKDEIPDSDIREIISRSISFEAPLVKLDDSNYILELFHGPTLAFKDFGARFMANILSHLNDGKQITILVATSGDTGSAVANGFYRVEGIKVVLLYPHNKVSKIQEQQLTTLDENITALEVEGNFDDCQRLVKTAFLDEDIKTKLILSSANSINIARLIPQSFYYISAYAQLKNKNAQTIFSVPSGNFGNLTGGLFAYKMGLPVKNFIASVNSNDVFRNYISTGIYNPKASVKTISNAMDVGNPSNFARLYKLFGEDYKALKSLIKSYSFNDDETKEAIKEVRDKFNYLIDPHGAVGYLGLKRYYKENGNDNSGVILETAHPAKFKDIVDKVLNVDITLPDELERCMKKEKHSIKISKKFEDLKEFLLKDK